MAGISSRGNGLDFQKPNLDLLGIAYIVIAILYTAFVAGELFVLYRHRNDTPIRLRNACNTAAAVVALHIYLVLVLSVYPENGVFKCGTEFWVMSIFLPFGMALFQGLLFTFQSTQCLLIDIRPASNVRVLSYYDNQKRLILDPALGARKKRFRFTYAGVREAWPYWDAARKTHVGIGFGLVITVSSYKPDHRVIFHLPFKTSLD